ncbi:MAG: PEP-CTERM sorting domain-containing protein [Alphaproteobacteria bacterium]|nr:PEP-CTERM sorting domain-containing protein [Alphaproteobacteria bacterium]
MFLVKRISACVLLAIGVLSMTAPSVFSAPITLPTGLNVGDQYRLFFVTTGGINSTSSNIADYNAFVTSQANAQAELAGLGTSWTAVASTATVNAIDNTSTPVGIGGIPIYLMNDTKLVDNYADLWDGTLDTAPNVFGDGTSHAGSNVVWTGTNISGTATANPLGSSSGTIGNSGFAGNIWTTDTTLSNFFSRRLYGISDVITVQEAVVSEPPPISLLALGLVGLVIVRRKRAASSAR